MKEIEYIVFATGQSAIEYKSQLWELVRAAEDAKAIPYLYAPNEAFFDTSLTDDHVKIFAFCDGQLVGFSFLRMMYQWPSYFDFIEQPSELCAMMLMNLVHPDFRGLGIGRELSSKRLEAAKDSGVKHLYGTVHPHNEASVKLLTQLGMKTIAEREIFTEKVLRKVMYKALNC